MTVKRTRSRASKKKAPVALIEVKTGDDKDVMSLPSGGEFIWVKPGGYKLDGREVVLTYGYWLGKYPVTQSQWEEVMGSNPSHFQGSMRPTVLEQMAGKNDLPVESVSWNDVQEFLKKASQRDGVTYRLPLEAEWEYAALAGQDTVYAGSNNASEVAWSAENSGGHTHPVGELMPNAWGFYDMSGNVWEWTHSDWNPRGPEGVNPGWVRVEMEALTEKERQAVNDAVAKYFDHLPPASEPRKSSVVIPLPSANHPFALVCVEETPEEDTRS